MKIRFFLLLTLCLVAGLLYAQVPQAINSQAVLRDAAGRLIANQSVGVRITIAQGSPTGTVAYEETHIATTNDNGLYTITIGAGTPATGSFATIDWGNGPYFITTDIDPAGGSNYTITTSQQFLSVPYALFADTAARVAQATAASNATHANTSDNATHATYADRADYADTALYYRERQVLTLGHDTIYLTGGSYVVLPPSGNVNINNHYIDSVVRANNSTIVNHYVDSVVQANNTTIVNNLQTTIRDSVMSLMRDSIISIIRDSATIVQQTIAAVPTTVCHASCGRVDSLERRLDSIIHIYDSLSRRLAQRIDSVSAANPANPCLGHSFTGIDNQTACDSYTWIDGNTYTVSTTTPTHTLVGGSAAGCDSTVTLHLTINHGTHNVASQCTSTAYSWHGNTYSNTGNYVYTYTNALGCASADTLHLTVTTSGAIVNGALPGEFSISDTKKVKFSQGNLQYQASTGIWRFAEHQYDYVGDADSGNVYEGGIKCNNENISSTYDGWIDLFGWGTSGYHDPADAYNIYYMPYDTAYTTINTTYNKYGYGPSTNQPSPSLTGSSEHYDWGVHNAISNGGNTPGLWRTMTKDEWLYLMNTRITSGVVGDTSNARYCKVNVSGVNGLIIFPDNYVHPTGVPVLRYVNRQGLSFSNTDRLTISQWSSMEAAGCAFLPLAGCRGRGAVIDRLDVGYYWLSTYYSSNNAYYIMIAPGSGFIEPRHYFGQYGGLSVRLVQDVQE